MIGRPQDGTRVRQRGKGAGVIVGPSRPPSSLYVEVLWDKTRKCENAPIEDIYPIIGLESCQERKIKQFKSEGIFYRTAGRLLRSDVLIECSTGANCLEKTLALLDEHKIEYEVGRTVTVAKMREGSAWWLHARSTGWLDWIKVHVPNAHPWGKQGVSDWQVLCSKPFVLNFLLIELGFSLGRRHELSRIIDRVPKIFQPPFEEGLFG